MGRVRYIMQPGTENRITVKLTHMRVHQIYPDIFPEEWASGWGEDEYGLWMAFTYKGVQQSFRWIEPGSFLMGSPEDEMGRDDDEDRHEVTLTQGFWIADTAVTQVLWEVVMGKDNNRSRFKDEHRPVENVSWNDAQAFIDKLNNKKAELKLCLPSEAQWEYACRAGTDTPFHFGQNINSEMVNFDGTVPYNDGRKSEYREETVPVRSLPSNAWGLFEMHGNVWEWCLDWWQEHLGSDPVTDPEGPGAERWGVGQMRSNEVVVGRKNAAPFAKKRTANIGGRS